MDTSDTVTINQIKLVFFFLPIAFKRYIKQWQGEFVIGGISSPLSPSRVEFFFFSGSPFWFYVPDGKDTSSLSKTSFLLNTTDSLLQDGGDLGGRGLGLGSVGTDLLGGTSQRAGDSRASLIGSEGKFVNVMDEREKRVQWETQALRYAKNRSTIPLR